MTSPYRQRMNEVFPNRVIIKIDPKLQRMQITDLERIS